MESAGKKLAGKKAVITGASRGIGAAVARAFAHEGADVALAHAPDDEMTELAQNLAIELRALGVKAVAISGDLASENDPGAIIRTAQKELGAITTLVCNAAANWRAPFDQYSVADWDLINNVNVRSTWLMAKEAKADAIVMGPGNAFHRQIPNDCPLILDAGAIKKVSRFENKIKIIRNL